MIEIISKQMYHCTCEWKTCQHQWDSVEIPKRCSACKRFSWNIDEHTRKTSGFRHKKEEPVPEPETKPKIKPKMRAKKKAKQANA